MRKGLFQSLLFTLLASSSVVAVAAPMSSSIVGDSPSAMAASTQIPADKLDLNVADAATLQRELVGIGEAKAKAIVTYRESNGSFASVDELLEVKGIGKAILDKNREKLEVN